MVTWIDQSRHHRVPVRIERLEATRARRVARSIVSCVVYIVIWLLREYFTVVRKDGMHRSSLNCCVISHRRMPSNFVRMALLWSAHSAIIHCWRSGVDMNLFSKIILPSVSTIRTTITVMSVELWHTESEYEHCRWRTFLSWSITGRQTKVCCWKTAITRWSVWTATRRYVHRVASTRGGDYLLRNGNTTGLCSLHRPRTVLTRP